MRDDGFKNRWPEGAVFGDAGDFSAADKETQCRTKIPMKLQTSQTAPLPSLAWTRICENVASKPRVSKVLMSHMMTQRI